MDRFRGKLVPFLLLVTFIGLDKTYQLTTESLNYESVTCFFLVQAPGDWDIKPMRLCQPPDGCTSPKYKLLCFKLL